MYYFISVTLTSLSLYPKKMCRDFALLLYYHGNKYLIGNFNLSLETITSVKGTDTGPIYRPLAPSAV